MLCRPARLIIGLAALIAAAAPSHAETTLDAAIDAAFRTNPQLDIQRLQSGVARENLALAQAERRPQISLNASGGYEYVDSNLPAPFNFGLGDRPIATAQLQAVQPIYTGGRVRAGISQARAGINAADLAFEAARQDLALSVIEAFVDVRSEREAVAIRQNAVEVANEQVRAASDRFDVGVVTRTDVALARARLEGARAALAGSEAALEGREAIFELLTGQPAGRLAPPPPVQPLPASIEEAYARAAANNPSIASAREEVRAASASVEAARAAGRPQISLVGTAAAQETFGDNNRRDTNLSAVAQARIPISTGGAVRAQTGAAQLRRDQARRQADFAEIQTRAQVAQAWHGYTAATRSIEASQRQVEAAEIAYEGARQELAVGVRTTLDVLDQEQELFEARLALVRAERDAYVAAHSLLRAMGDLDFGG
jgi:outer membrane protein